jgi:hypothetical protein
MSQEKRSVFWEVMVSAILSKKVYRLERILTMVYGAVVQWLRLALSEGPNWIGLPCPIHLRTETNPVSETLWSFVKLPHTRWWTESKRNQIVLYKKVYMYMRPISNGFRDRAISLSTVVWIWCPILSFPPARESLWNVSWPLWLLIMVLYECCETCRKSSQMPNMPICCPHTSFVVHWCWRRNFRKCIILGKLYQLCHLNDKYRY